MTAADAVPPLSPPETIPTEPSQGYVICSEHRSGSTLLCHWLRSTGVLGHPREYFSITEDALAIERDPSRLDDVLRAAATANGVYGIKLFSQQFDNTMKAAWLPRLPGARFIHLERRDLLGQAISMVRALQTEQYEAGQVATAVPRYSRRAIARQVRRLAEAHARWRCWFARNGLEVLWLVYEDMVGDPDATVAAVARHVGIPAPAPIDPGAVRVAVQRDAVSAEWRARFLAEAGDMRYLDHPLGKPRVWARRLARDAGQAMRVARRRLAGR